MFMIVKYGDGKEHFFNTDCRTKVLLDCIKEKCDALNEGLVDLADENGELMFLHERQNHYGSEFLKPRGIYILIRRETCSQNFPVYTPLLNDQAIVSDEFLRHLSMVREDAIRRDEDQKLVENERISNGRGKAIGNKRNNTKDANFKRMHSLSITSTKKHSKVRTSR